MARRITKQAATKYVFSATDEPVAEVCPGESVTVECEIAYPLKALEETLSGATPGKLNFPYFNPSTGPLSVAGAESGQVLSVKIEAIELDENGFMAVLPNSGIFPDWILQRTRDLIQIKPIRVEDGVVHWSDSLKMPAKPMIGVIGVAPKLGGVLTLDNGTHGGNIDVQEIAPGTTIHLPIEHAGGLLYLGDCHARQGDGEGSGFSLEIGARVTVNLSIIDRPARMTWPRFETESHIGTIGCARPLEDAMRISFAEMLYWLVDQYGFPELEAYMLLGAVAEARCTQMGNPKFTYVCKVSRTLLPK